MSASDDVGGESQGDQIHMRSASFPRARRRVRIKRSAAFLLMWAGAFFAGLLWVPGQGLVYLAIEALVNAVCLFILVYGILGIFNPSTGRKVFAVLLTLLIMGAVYQSPALLSTRSGAGLFEWEASQLTSLISHAQAATTFILTTASALNKGGNASGGASSQTASVYTGSSATSRASAGTATGTAASGIPNPTFINGQAKISYPSSNTTLVNYALGLINRDRAANGLSTVVLSKVPSGQQHADSMLYFGYFSHWDTQGYKPYMRYTLLGGQGAVEENIGRSACTNSTPESTSLVIASCDVATIENGVTASEWAMMNNDVTCCNNGHRNNILDPLHNAVSIGIAYDAKASTVYFVEDFENAYVSLQEPIYSGGVVTLSGTTTRSIQPYEVVVAYDTVHPWNISALDNTFAYDSGTPLGAVFAPCPAGHICSPTTSNGDIAAYASDWSYTAGEITLQFSLSPFIHEHGNGVYTLYLWDSQHHMYTSLSVFVGAQ